MTRKYELIAVLDTKGKEESADAIVQRIGKEIEGGGGRLEEIDHIGRKDFAYTPGDLDSGYYVNFKFEAEPTLVDSLRAKLALDDDVHLQHYQRA